jgi:hypothetical protein
MAVSLLEGALAGWHDDQIQHYRLAFGDGAGMEYRQQWYSPEPAGEWNNEGLKQWSKPGAKVYLPVLPNTEYAVALEARVPKEALEPGAGLYYGDQCVLPFEAESLGMLHGQLTTGGTGYIALEVRCKAWKPMDILEGSQDNRDLGIAVRSVTLRAAGAGERIFSANTGGMD